MITGAQGLVGRYLTAHILGLEKESAVVGIGRSGNVPGFFTHANRGHERSPLPPDLLARFDGRYRYQRLSLHDTAGLRELIRELRPHCVFHLASALHTAPERDLVETNIEGTASLLDAMAGSDALAILGSSGSVYGEPLSLPILESHPCNPADMYGITKLAAEHVARIKAARSGLAFMVARIFNIVGPGQDENHVCGRLAAQLASLADSRHPLLEVGPLEPTRDFIDVRDVAAGLLLLAQRGERGGTYNLASGSETPIQFILSELARVSGLNGRIRIARRDDRPAGVPRHFADVSHVRRLGFVPAYSIRDSLADLFRYHEQLAGTAQDGLAARP